MRPGVLLLLIAVSAGAIGYVELRHQAERELWRAETSRLTGMLERAELQAESRAETLSSIERDYQKEQEAAARFADLEAKILDAATELALLESNRAVARDRADSAIHDLQEQVRALTAIETDLAVLDRRRNRLADSVEEVEGQLHQAEVGAAERQKRAESLDRHIAGLAIRRETLLASLQVAESQATAVPAASEEAPAAEQPAAVEPGPAVEAVALADPVEPEHQDRTLGLYQFGSLSATPELAGDGEASSPSGDQAAADSNWAEDQYLLGLNLLSSAERNSGTRELNDAILAFKAVLGEWPKERDRMRWAIARSDLGYALALLGKRERKGKILEEAAAASRDALGEFEPSETPLLWAAAQHHLGVSLGGLADISGDQSLRQASIRALEQAIATFKDAGAESDAQKVEKRLRETVADGPARSEAAAPDAAAVE
ncbi:MAG: hypothetical protein R3F54_05940 [Alphaproteobacteria bacterium]